jgi:exopolyphosphatase/guanosine-5'-triphosphate,3'-diphosphate pyrophosphatase
VCFSAHGLREGYVLDRMRIDAGEHDALRVACDWWARQSELGLEMVDLLMIWTAPLFAGGGEIDLRLRRAACQLSNIGWHQHPEYRAQQALDEILHAPTLPLRHAERSFLALVLWYRYGGRKSAPEAAVMAGLLPAAMAHRARILGLALRLAYKLSGGAASILQEAALQFEQGSLQLRAPASLIAEPVERDLASLAKAVDNEPSD